MLVQSVKLRLVAISLVVGLVGCTTVPQEVDQPDPQVTVDIKKVTVKTKPVDLNSIVANTPKTNPIVKPVTKPIARPPIVVQASVTPKPKVVTKVPATKETTPVSVASKVSEPNKGIKPSDIKRYIPVQASNHLPTLKKETDYYFPTLTFKHYFGGLIEQESCISLTHSKCWNPKSSLKTKREEGAGLGQLTRAYKADGSIRFDSLAEMRNRYKEDLKELAWSNIYQRPDLQIRAILLMTKDNHRIFNLVPSTEIEKWKMIDAAYNSGPGSVKKRRTTCGLKKDCDPTIWKHNLEDTVVLSQKPIYGNRSPHFINNEHVEMIFDHRMHKYEPFF